MKFGEKEQITARTFVYQADGCGHCNWNDETFLPIEKDIPITRTDELGNQRQGTQETYKCSCCGNEKKTESFEQWSIIAKKPVNELWEELIAISKN